MVAQQEQEYINKYMALCRKYDMIIIGSQISDTYIETGVHGLLVGYKEMLENKLNDFHNKLDKIEGFV